MQISEWIEALESGEYPKSRAQFQMTEEMAEERYETDYSYAPGDAVRPEVGYCCLGVRCVVEGLAFAPDQGLFEREDPEGFYSADWNGATLPNDDFVFETVYVAPWTGDARLAVTELPFQSYLADINDQADTFGPVIAALRAFDEGRRQFPAAADWVEQHA